MSNTKKAGIAFGILFFITLSAIVLNSGLQSSWWTVEVKPIRITNADGYGIAGKLYLPEGASSSNPLPAVLAIPGYNNDKDVQRPHAIELSKRGIIVLAIDVLNHGDSDYANTSVVSPVPQAALDWLRAQPYVDSSKLGVTGHSMGALYTMNLAVANPDLEAIAPVAFSPGLIALYGGYALRAYLNPDIDILHVASWGEEFSRASDETINQYITRCLSYIGPFVGTSDPEFFHTYGDFTDGATRFVLLKKTHPGQTHSRLSTAEITKFFLASLKDIPYPWAEELVDGKLTYWIADILGVISLAGLIFSIVPLAVLFMGKKTFKEVHQPMPRYSGSYAPKPWVWWIFGTVNATIGALTYAFNTEYSNDGPRQGAWVFDGTMIHDFAPNIWRSGIADDFLAWFSVNAGVMILIVIFWYAVIYRPKGVGFYQLGANYLIPADELEGRTKPNGWRVFGKTVALAAILFVYMYGLVWFASNIFHVEIRGPWSGLKLMTSERAGDYFNYYGGPLLFWTFNAGIWMFGMMRQKEYGSEAKTVFIWWIKICLVTVTGLVILNMIQYVPMYIGLTGPYLSDRLAFAPMDLLQTWSFIPYAMGFYLVAVLLFRRTGKIWLGTLMCSAITTWMLVTGYIMF